MSEEFVPADQVAPAIEEKVLIGMANAIQASLIGVDNAFGEAVVINAVAQYVLTAALSNDLDRRETWNAFVGTLRDTYFALAKLEDQS